jgi:fructosamine-3-kinase
MEKIPGMVLHQAYAWLSHQAQEQITRQLADCLGELHQINSIGFGGVEISEEELNPDWPATWLPVLDEIIEQIKATNLLNPGFLKKIEHVRPELPKLLSIIPQSTLTHYDIWSGNVMVNTVNGNAQISGFIDVSGQWADYARELSFMEVFGLATPDFYHYYQAYHPLDDEFQLRKSIYQLRTHLKHMTMYPGESYYRQGAQRSVQIIENALLK